MMVRLRLDTGKELLQQSFLVHLDESVQYMHIQLCSGTHT